MQTFLPYPDFKRSAQCLDSKRLGKQRVEAYQIIRILLGIQKSKGFMRHPAVMMWQGYESALKDYINAICEEWTSRGYRDTVKAKTNDLLQSNSSGCLPDWFGNAEFHAAHRSNLLRKNIEFYSRYNWQEKPGLEYVWPSKVETQKIRA